MVRILKLELKRNTFTLDDDIDLVEIVEIEGDLFLVGLHLTGREHDWDFNLTLGILIIVRLWHQNCTRYKIEIKMW